MRSLKRTEVLKTNTKNISYAAKVLKKGGLVAFPTETVYGLGANLLDKKAIDRLYRVKKRPRSKPFTILIADEGSIREAGCIVTGVARSLIDEFWPGPLTVILESRDREKIGFRMPDNDVALRLIRMSGVPVACPSANLSGREVPKDAKGVLGHLDGKIDILLDGWKSRIGIESTVVDVTVTPPKILREGAIKRKKIFSALKQ